MSYEEINKMATTLKQAAGEALGPLSFPRVSFTLSDDISAIPVHKQQVMLNLQANLPREELLHDVVEWLNLEVFDGMQIAEEVAIAEEEVQARVPDSFGSSLGASKSETITRVAIDISADFSLMAEKLALYTDDVTDPSFFRWNTRYDDHYFNFNDLVCN